MDWTTGMTFSYM